MTMDDVDRAFVDSLIPPGSAVPELLAIVQFLDEAGNPRWKVYNQTDQRVSGVIGLLELAKHHFLTEAEVQEG